MTGFKPGNDLDLPGLGEFDFDTVDGSRFVRFSFAGTGSDIEEALDRLDRYLSARGRG